MGPLLIWLYLMDGKEKHMQLLKRAYAWHETLRQRELEPWQLEAWEAISKAYSDPRWGRTYYLPGWPDGVLPGTSSGMTMNAISKKSMKKPRMKIVTLAATRKPTLPPGKFVSSSSIQMSP